MVKCLLEALSSTEDSRLNYIEQHASAIGLSQDSARARAAAVAKASPMGETLDGHVRTWTRRRWKEPWALASVPPERRRRRARARAGRFIDARLCLRRGSLVKPHAGKLFKALLGAARSDRSAAAASARRAARARRRVARHATEAR